MELPSVADVNEQRVNRFKQRISEVLAAPQNGAFRALIEQYEREHNVPAIEIAAALASMVQGKAPLFLEGVRPQSLNADRTAQAPAPPRADRSAPAAATARSDRPRERTPQERPTRIDRPARTIKPHRSKETSIEAAEPARKSRKKWADELRETFRVEVGSIHGAKPANIVGAIANEADIEGQYIGRIDIRDDHSFVDLPEGMPKEIFRDLQKVRVAGQPLRISRVLRSSVDSAPQKPEQQISHRTQREHRVRKKG
jgi:ATP-dependent RNA helicase DeaD